MEISNWFVPNIGDQRGAKWGGQNINYSIGLCYDSNSMIVFEASYVNMYM